MSRPWICDVCNGRIPDSQHYRVMLKRPLLQWWSGGWWETKDICSTCLDRIGSAVRKEREE